MSNRSKFFPNLSLNLLIPFAQPGNFSVSGGDSIFPSATKPAAGPVKPGPLAHVVLVLNLLCSWSANTKWHTITGRG